MVDRVTHLHIELGWLQRLTLLWSGKLDLLIGLKRTSSSVAIEGVRFGTPEVRRAG